MERTKLSFDANGDDWLGSGNDRSCSGEGIPIALWIGVWMEPPQKSGHCRNETNLCSCWGSNPVIPVRKFV